MCVRRSAEMTGIASPPDGACPPQDGLVVTRALARHVNGKASGYLAPRPEKKPTAAQPCNRLGASRRSSRRVREPGGARATRTIDAEPGTSSGTFISCKMIPLLHHQAAPH